MKAILSYVGLGIAGCLLGGVSALWMSGLLDSKSGSVLSEVNVENWMSDWSIGAAAADGYTRARVARYGLLGLAKSEAVYFVRSVDETGAPLQGHCSYALSGAHQDALWWSITLYDEHSRLPINDDKALSIDLTQVGSAENWAAVVSPMRPQSGHWISSLGAETFDLTLRIYQPSNLIITQPEKTVRAPKIRKMRCEESA